MVAKYPLVSRRNRKSTKDNPWWVRRWHYFYLRFLRLKGHPQEMARGLSVGVFIGCFPFFGLQVILSVLLAVLVRGNKILAAAGTWVSNPLTGLPIYAFNFKVGQLILRDYQFSIEQLDFQSWDKLQEAGFLLVATVFLGSFVVGSIAAILTYFFSLYAIDRWRESRQVKSRR